MAIDTKPNFNNGKFEQCVGDIMNLSGCTQIYGVFDIETSATLTICENAGNGKILTSDATGVATWQTGGITAISGGSGMNFSPITTTGEIILGTPSAILNTSTDVSSGTTHNHAFSASTFVTGTQGILVDGNNRFYLDDAYVIDSTLPDLYSFSGITANQNLGSLPTGQTLGMVYITNTGTTAATVNLGTTALGNDITPFQPIDIDAGEDVSITVNMRLSLTANTIIYINSDDWTNVGLNVQWANVTFKNVPLPTGGTSGLLTASNGLTAVGLDVKLGGTLCENTTINYGTGANSSISINNTSANLDIYSVDSTNTYYTNIYGYPSVTNPVTALLTGVQAGDSSDISVCKDKTTITGYGTNDFNYYFGNTGFYATQDFTTGYTDNHFVQKSYVDSLSGGTGGVGTLQQVTDSGNTTTNSIIIGVGNTATGTYSFAQGCQVQATSAFAHAEGCLTCAITGEASHAEGYNTVASGWYAHAEGHATLASGNRAHAEGCNTCATGQMAHAEGLRTKATGSTSHAEGIETVAAIYSHAEGYQSKAFGGCSHAEGVGTCTTNLYGHSEGYLTIASGGEAAHAEGACTIASGWYAHAEGFRSLASGNRAHAEGCLTCAVGDNSHAQGVGTKATGATSHAEGGFTCAIGQYSHAEGYQTLATGYSQHVSGQFNLPKAGSIFEIGIGADVSNKCNVFEAYCTNYVTINNVLRLNPSTAPGSPLEGMIYYDSGTNKLRFYNGTGWETITSA